MSCKNVLCNNPRGIASTVRAATTKKQYYINRPCSASVSNSLGDAHISNNIKAASQSRRDIFYSIATIGITLTSAQSAQAGQEVGGYLPSAGIDDLVLFVPDDQKTPAIRAGTIKRNAFYKFGMPASYKEVRVANINSGNFCQPRCGEPWTEVVFESDKDGKIQLIAAPLAKFTNKINVKVEDLGTPAELLERVGAFITGTYLDEEDVVSASSKVLDDGRTYYYYEVYAPYGTIGPHTLTACTTRGEVCYLFVVSATDKQWPKLQKKLRTVVETFRA